MIGETMNGSGSVFGVRVSEANGRPSSERLGQFRDAVVPRPLTPRTSNFSKAPAYIDALSPGGVLYGRNPDRATQELQRLQEREMKKVRQIETMSPGMGVGYWNRNPVLSRVGSLEMTDDSGVNVYALNGQPIAYGSRGPDNTYSVSQTRPNQAGTKAATPPQAAQATSRQGGNERIERSKGRYERPQQTVLGLPYRYDINKLPGGPARAEFRAEHPVAPVPGAPQERPRETVLGVENVRAQSSSVNPQFRKAPWIGERIAQDVAAAADVSKNILRQMIAFPAATIGNPLAAAAATVAHPWRRLASKIAPSLVEAPRHPLETGENVEKSIYDYVTRPNEPKAELTTRALEKISKIPPLQLANKPSEALERVKSDLTDRDYPNAGRAVRMSGNVALLGAAGKGALRQSYRRGILDLYEQAMSGGKGEAIRYGKVGGVEAAKLKAGTRLDIDFEGYEHTIHADEIRHMLKRHGNPETEAARGQIAVTKDDIAMIPEIIRTADKITTGHRAQRTGPDTVRYEKRIDGRIYFVEEVRTGKQPHELAAKTLWIKKRRRGEQ